MSVPFGQLLCECGKTYAPTSDGRWIHRRLFEHTPCARTAIEDIPIPPHPEPMSTRCEMENHKLCRRRCRPGGYGDEMVACACSCHDEEEGAERAFSQVRRYNGTNRTAPEGARNADEGLTANLRSQEGAGPQC